MVRDQTPSRPPRVLRSRVRRFDLLYYVQDLAARFAALESVRSARRQKYRQALDAATGADAAAVARCLEALESCRSIPEMDDVDRTFEATIDASEDAALQAGRSAGPGRVARTKRVAAMRRSGAIEFTARFAISAEQVRDKGAVACDSGACAVTSPGIRICSFIKQPSYSVSFAVGGKPGGAGPHRADFARPARPGPAARGSGRGVCAGVAVGDEVSGCERERNRTRDVHSESAGWEEEMSAILALIASRPPASTNSHTPSLI